MRSRIRTVCCYMATLSAALAAAGTPASAANPAGVPTVAGEVLIPYEKFKLDNGLTVIVHTDRKAPIVAVNLWYHVGSKNEPPGRTGFAHLFEHLMFQGSENFNDEYFKPFEQVGATSQNGTTSFDRTNYFQNVPTTALDMALWMESDRMGHLLGVLDQARLDEQRSVVKNEKRQNENRPYGRVFETVLKGMFPEGHPYRWTPIGSMADLEAASLDDVKDWFGTYYGAANAVLVLAGDIDAATAREKAQRYFGHIPPGPALTRPGVNVAPRTASSRAVMYDQVAQTRVYRFWNTPPLGTADDDLLSIAGEILGGGKTSRLYERLVYRDRLADTVGAGQSGYEIAGMFAWQADLKQGASQAALEAAATEELERFLASGPTPAELERARTTLRAGVIRGLERIGGFGGKADVLAACEVYTNDPGCYRTSLAGIEAATVEQVRDAARRWLAAGDFTLEVQPQPKYRNAEASAVDRKAGPPVTSEFPSVGFPKLERAELGNGMRVVIARRPGVPIVRVSALFDAGYVTDQGRALGTSSFTMSLLDEGTTTLDALGIARRAEELGAAITAGSSIDTSSATLDALADRLGPSLELFADVLRNPAFPQSELDRVRGEWLAALKREQASPEGLAARLLPSRIYGESHPYGIPLSGTGTEASIASLTREDLQRFHRDWLRPDNATLIVVGDTTRETILPLLEAHFGDWRAPAGTRPAKTRPAAPPRSEARVYLVDRPGAIQSTILAGLAGDPGTADDRIELDTANMAFGGYFSSRLNLNLREDKGWSYGSRSSFVEATGPRPWILSAPVQTDKTVEALQEIRAEITRFVGEKPLTEAEFAKIRDRDVRAMPGRYESNAAVAGAIAENLVYGRPDDYVSTLKARLESQSLDGVRGAARRVIDPAHLTWVIVGDLAKIEAPIRALGLGAVEVLDSDGRKLR